MATTQMSSNLPKPSFAKVAASTSRERAPTTQRAPTIQGIENRSPTTRDTPTSISPVPPPPTADRTAVTEQNVGAIGRTPQTLAGLRLDAKPPNLVVNGTGSISADRVPQIISRESGSDDSQRADSSSELGTKPPSLDGKSITSGTTFALDEKESLRPDDSASVKAAAEDDDAFSIRGSFIAGSRMGSELAARVRGIQLGDIPERKLVQPAPGIHVQGILTPQSASSEQVSGVNPAMALAGPEGSADALNVIYRQAPDDKLLEALASQKDRVFLLRLEKDVIDFVQDSKEPYMDLPPSNSFCRMLTHKLADYYHMTHSYEPHIGSVRIFRTPFCRVPPSLSSMTPPTESTSSTPPPAVQVKKIMRRGQDGDGTPISAEASKATSEVGSDVKTGREKQLLSNQKLTREEREEIYKVARERIFGSSEDNVAENEDENDLSRASSVSANRSNVGKKSKPSKQRRDDSDSFDSRHHYTPYWGPQQQTWVATQPSQPQFMMPPNGQFNAQPQGSYTGQVAPVYTQQVSSYPGSPGMMPNASYPYQYSQPAQSRYPPTDPMAAYGHAAPTGPAQPSWQPGYHQSSPQPRHAVPPGPGAQVGIPYAYGQLPVNANPHDPKSQHPIPGSYNRNHSFNPMTQSFVPGGGAMTGVPPPQPPFTAPGSHHGSPQIGAPHPAYSPYQQPVAAQPYGGGYLMARQGSSNSMPAYHSVQHGTPPHAQHVPMHHPPHGPHSVQQLPPTQHINVPPRPPPNAPQAPGQAYGHLPTYGNPSTLPQKPATGI